MNKLNQTLHFVPKVRNIDHKLIYMMFIYPFHRKDTFKTDKEEIEIINKL